MTFLAPLWIGLAGAASLGVLALHLITTQRPPVTMLPTARFVPGGDARAAARAARPTDLLLLLLRVAALMLLGTAFAHPVFRSGGGTTARVVMADQSTSAGADALDSARALVRTGDTLIVFDSAGRGSISAALVAARHAARRIATHADSVELVIVSPVTAHELDAASAPLARGWPGRMRLVRSRPVVAKAADTRLIRTAPAAADSAFARNGGVVVEWPVAAENAAVRTEGVWSGASTVVAPLSRITVPMVGTVIARWWDGSAAASEQTLGAGCIRAVGIGTPLAGDVTLQPAYQAIVAGMMAPCGGAIAATAPDSLAALFTRAGAPAAAAAFEDHEVPSRVAPWLIGAALLLLLLEWRARQSRVAVAV